MKATSSPAQLRLMIPAAAYDATLRFYADGLGLAALSSANRTVRFRLGDGELLLVPIDGDLVVRETGLCLHVNGLTACIEHLLAEGLIFQDVQDWKGNAFERVIEDPAGNLITLVEALH